MCDATGGKVCPRVSIETEGTVRRGGKRCVIKLLRRRSERAFFKWKTVKMLAGPAARLSRQNSGQGFLEGDLSLDILSRVADVHWNNWQTCGGGDTDIWRRPAPAIIS